MARTYNEGPNMYAFLDDNQREVSAEFSKTHVIHNYVDHRDIVPIGYGKNKPHIGDMFFIDSRKASSIVSQHSWGGYHYDEFGNIVLDSKHCLQAVDDSLEFGVAELAKLRQGFSQSGGGLSSAERIYLDASEAKLMVSGQRELLNSYACALKTLVQNATDSLSDDWQNAYADAMAFRSRIPEYEALEALSDGGFDKLSMVDTPTYRWQTELDTIAAVTKELDTVLTKIDSAINHQVSTDQELARELFS
jgi:hypothetical protein